MYLVQQNGLKVQQADPNRLEPSWNLISSMILAKEHQIIKKKKKHATKESRRVS